jgi:hypothetical protein
MTASWYGTFRADGQIVSRQQLSTYLDAAKTADAAWASR